MHFQICSSVGSCPGRPGPPLNLILRNTPGEISHFLTKLPVQLEYIALRTRSAKDSLAIEHVSPVPKFLPHPFPTKQLSKLIFIALNIRMGEGDVILPHTNIPTRNNP